MRWAQTLHMDLKLYDTLAVVSDGSIKMQCIGSRSLAINRHCQDSIPRKISYRIYAEVVQQTDDDIQG